MSGWTDELLVSWAFGSMSCWLHELLVWAVVWWIVGFMNRWSHERSYELFGLSHWSSVGRMNWSDESLVLWTIGRMSCWSAPGRYFYRIAKSNCFSLSPSTIGLRLVACEPSSASSIYIFNYHSTVDNRTNLTVSVNSRILDSKFLIPNFRDAEF